MDNRGRVRGLASRYSQHPRQTAIRERQPEADRERTVDCPRCGADNRNWLYLSLRPYIEQIPRFGQVLIVLFTVGLILAGPILLMFRHADRNESDTRNIILIIVAYLAIILPILILSPRWRDLRDYKYLRRVTGLSWHRRISPLWSSGLLLVFLLAVVLPVGRYLIFPVVQDKLEALVAPEPQLEGSARVTKILGDIDSNNMSEVDINSLALSVNNIQRILTTREICQTVEWNVVRTRLEHVKQLATYPADTAVIIDVIQNLNKALAGGACRPEYLWLASGILQEYQKQLNNNVASPQCATITDGTKKSLCRLNERLTESLAAIENPEIWKWETLAGMTEERMLLRTRETLVDLRQFLAASDTFPEQDQIDAELDNIKRLFESRTLQNELTQNVDFVVGWMKLVGISGILATIIAVSLAGQEERLYDPNLPRPVFNSVAVMAPTVIWELNQTVGLPVSASRIQWMNIERNGQGGVTLTGLYRSALALNDNASNRVRGQEFVVKTDPWCYIQNTSITDVMVAPPLKDDKPPTPTEDGVPAPPAFSVNNGRIQSI